MRKSWNLAAVLMLSVISGSACSLHVLDRWDGPLVRSHVVAMDTGELWLDLTADLPTTGLLVAGISETRRTIEFSWVTAPGDGRQYLDCDSDAVGSASLRPRVVLAELESGTRVEVSSITRATAASECTSTGQFEEWLLARIGVPAGQIALSGTRPVQ